jgi:hypothetical protein
MSTTFYKECPDVGDGFFSQVITSPTSTAPSVYSVLYYLQCVLPLCNTFSSLRGTVKHVGNKSKVRVSIRQKEKPIQRPAGSEERAARSGETTPANRKPTHPTPLKNTTKSHSPYGQPSRFGTRAHKQRPQRQLGVADLQSAKSSRPEAARRRQLAHGTALRLPPSMALATAV